MKNSIFKLLFAALVLSTCMQAWAEDIHYNNGDRLKVTGYAKNGESHVGDVITIKDGDIIDLYFTLTRRNSTDFTNIQLDLNFPGNIVKPAYNEDMMGYCWEGDDCLGPRGSYVSFSDNLSYPEFYPNHTVVGINFTKTAITANPCAILVVRVEACKGLAPGEYKMTVGNLRYTSYNDDTWRTNDVQDACTFVVEEEPVEDTYNLYLGEAHARKNTRCSLTMNMKNHNAITLWQTDMILPGGFTVAADEWGDPSIAISGNRTSSSRHSIASNELADGTWRLVCSSMKNQNFLDNDGEVATITLNVSDKVKDGVYPVYLKNILLVEDDETTHEVERSVSYITVKNYKRGDVNGDDIVDVEDVSALIDVVLGLRSADKYEGRAYVNDDDLIDVNDINAVLDIILGFQPEEPADVREYVDLGLPGGTLWATCNVGADKPEESGLYFAWGETRGYTKDENHSFDWDNYKWCNGSESKMTKYSTDSSYGKVDNKTVLDPEDDAATANWGIGWRMPTKEEIDDLCNSTYCTWTWETNYNGSGVSGYEVKSKSNSNSIFLPASGCRGDTSLYNEGSFGSYWSRELETSNSYNAYCLYFYSSYIDCDYFLCDYGRSVRAVRVPSE